MSSSDNDVPMNASGSDRTTDADTSVLSLSIEITIYFLIFPATLFLPTLVVYPDFCTSPRDLWLLHNAMHGTFYRTDRS